MKILKQILIIFLICYISKIISLLLPFAFPSNVISMVFLLFLLITKGIRVENVRELSEFLLQNMAFFFIPSGVAIIEEFSFLKGNIAVVLFITLITTVITFAAAGYAVTFTVKLLRKRKDQDRG